MSLTRTARLSDASSAGYGTAAWVSGSFVPTANSLLVVAAMAVHSAGSGTNIGDDLTISGGSLTFTKRAVVNDTTYWGSGLVIFTAAVGASPSSMTLTLDCGANNIDVYAVHVVDYTGYDTGTPTGATASTASGATNGLGAITLSAAPAVDSEVFATLHGESVNSSNSGASGAGWTELYDSAIAYTVFQSQVRSGSTSTSVEWSDVSVDSGNLYESHMAALEIRAGVAAAPAVEESYLASRRNRPGRGPYSLGRYFRQRIDAFTSLIGSIFNDTISEAGSAADSVSSTVAYSATIAESASAADSLAATLAAVAAIAETGTIADSINAALAATAAISETGDAQFTPTTGAAISAAIVETATAADSVASVLAAVAALSESGAASDSVSAIASLVAALSESMTASDTVSWGGAVYSVDIVEAANATNTLTAAVSALAALAETGNATDTVSALASLQAALAEAGTALDTLTVTGVYGVSVSEAGDITFTVSVDSGILPGTPARSVTVRAANRTITVRAANRTVTVH